MNPVRLYCTPDRMTTELFLQCHAITCNACTHSRLCQWCAPWKLTSTCMVASMLLHPCGAHVHMPGAPTVRCRRCSSSPTFQTVTLVTRQLTVAAKVQQKDTLAGDQDSSEQPTEQQADPNRGRNYYVGLLKSDIKVTNDATSADMLSRSLQLAGECNGWCACACIVACLNVPAFAAWNIGVGKWGGTNLYIPPRDNY